MKQSYRHAEMLVRRFGEWLDADERLTKKPRAHDLRTHEDLVWQFLGEVFAR